MDNYTNLIILILFFAAFIGAIVYIRVRIWRISHSLYKKDKPAKKKRKAGSGD